ncbi:MAG: histidine kinase [Marinobacter sp.]|nr:histidine kinase [Marinobacter sp.]
MALTPTSNDPVWQGPVALAQRARLFRIYNHYRIVACLILASLAWLGVEGLDSKYSHPDYYQASMVAYLALNVFLGLLMLAGISLRNRHISLSIIVDILVLHALLLFSSGVTNGLANLIIVAVAAGNILTPSRVGVFYAALAAITSLSIASWGMMAEGGDPDDIVRAGTLGILYFTVAFTLLYITRRMMRSEALASSRARSIVELEQINEQIIQRMRTGIVVTDRFGHIRLANAAAGELLFGHPADLSPRQAARIRTLPGALKQQLDRWLRAPEERSEPFQPTAVSPPLQASFTRLSPEGGEQILIFIEDLSKVTQQAQQMKLASLGRLTAGIAHEIRNPLGAMSHAAQLMAESPQLDEGDLKMLDIIQRHARRVNNIIENILDLSRRRAATTELVDVSQWLDEFASDYQQSISNRFQQPVTISLHLANALPPARFDPSQIEQVLVNLCDNGLRYSLAHSGRPAIHLSADVTADGERAYIDVRDEGPGIDADNRLSVFEPFYTTDKGGTGLGLYLARELCEANQAHLSLLDDSHAGACFRITFAPHGRLT